MSLEASGPPEVGAGHPEEPVVVGSVELPQCVDCRLADDWVRATLGLPETMGPCLAAGVRFCVVDRRRRCGWCRACFDRRLVFVSLIIPCCHVDGSYFSRDWPARVVGRPRIGGVWTNPQAGEALDAVEVEESVGDEPLKAEEILEQSQFPRWIDDQPLPMHEVDLGLAEVGQPSFQVLGVHTNPDGSPRGDNCPGDTDDCSVVVVGRFGSVETR